MSISLEKYLKIKLNNFLASKKASFPKIIASFDNSNRCLRNFQSPAVMSLITEKDVHGFSAVHYAAKKGDIKV